VVQADENERTGDRPSGRTTANDVHRGAERVAAVAQRELVAFQVPSWLIQNVLEPFAFGSRLRLHPLAVLITVTAATMLFGILGAILAAPLTSAAVNAYHELHAARGQR
jgi:AI-2E family transporter